MNLLVDMNLSPRWVEVFARQGWSASHWSQIGSPSATDRQILIWARQNGYVVFTHDLDFSTLLALAHADGPSVVQLRGQNVLPDTAQDIVLRALEQHRDLIDAGALIVVDESRSRARVLPLNG